MRWDFLAGCLFLFLLFLWSLAIPRMLTFQQRLTLTGTSMLTSAWSGSVSMPTRLRPGSDTSEANQARSLFISANVSHEGDGRVIAIRTSSAFSVLNESIPLPALDTRRSHTTARHNNDGRPLAARCHEYKILQWNILDGGQRRLAGIGKLLREGRYDVVSLNELNGIEAVRLESMAREWGYTQTAHLRKSPYALGLLSKHPMRVRLREAGNAFAHGMLCADLLGTLFCVTHLTPNSVTRRVMEARAIQHVARTAPRGFVLLGDLNTLSPLDARAHTLASLPARMSHGSHAQALARKFLTADGTRIDYAPMQTLLDTPLWDVGNASGHTVPTDVNADAMHFAQLRLDYCLVNSHVLGTCAPAPSVHVLRLNRTQALSDHFPIEISMWLHDDAASSDVFPIGVPNSP
mmetsp:Transcript_43214/g.90227  ORF Transcript_43214/g.90227 Transcript_43214/m.90227 type:complete len:406 (+) Transcript_43214:197-1414(+)